MKQLGFKELRRQTEFGGDLLKGKRKGRRPFSRKSAIHVTFRTKASVFLPSERKMISVLVRKLAYKRQLRIYETSINSNHLHLLLRSPSRKLFQDFLRELSIKIVMGITGARKGKSLLSNFWNSRPWSRIVDWGRSFQNARNYVFRNQLETKYLIPYDRTVKTDRILMSYLLSGLG